MTELNNLIIEGYINEPQEKAGDMTVFYLNNQRKGETITLPVVTYGELGKKVLTNLHEGMTIRAVGRLAMVRNVVTIVACHIEYRSPKYDVLSSEEDGDEF